jgi:DNA-binding winged helix-turn-helix (wHTH) protein
MLHRFNEFEFNSANLLLTKHGKALAIRHTEAKLLAVLLEQVGTILNKESILAHVWQNKVVSEQVVFQNISNLRNLFGNEAIKTFPKRGYQWQIATEVVPAEIQVQYSSQRPALILEAQRHHFMRKPAIFICIIFITVSIFYLISTFDDEKSDSVINLAYIPITQLNDTSSDDPQSIILEDNADFTFTELTHLNTELFENAVEIEYPKLSATYPFILTGKIHTYQQQTYLD